MELKDYQMRSLDAFVRWTEALKNAHEDLQEDAEYYRGKFKKVPDSIQNYPKIAWENLAHAGNVTVSSEYLSRFDGVGRPIPHVCFKVPTGGGKTLLATAAIERLNQQNGFTLWITPTSEIFRQTKAALWNREHPYRQMLERASGGRVRLLEKEDDFEINDVNNYLCVMLLMLPAANRRKGKEFLRMFRNSGRYADFFPEEGDILSEKNLLQKCPDLELEPKYRIVKRSLFNVFKILKPVVVLDEAHKAYGAKKSSLNQEFVASVNRLNPSLVIELSATPNANISNLLVDVSGLDLVKEEMIKLPVQVTSQTNVDWQHTLIQAKEKLVELSNEAENFFHNSGRYIRPIAVVRVERTGSEQRDGLHIHAEDVRDYLIQQLGVSSDWIRVKSSENDELGRENLLSEYSSVRWIITKAAIMEGWDCSFAYILVMLDNTQSPIAITQLVGRVLRQPHALRTHRKLLDQCYVYCWNTDVETAVMNVKNGLELEGLTGLGGEVQSDAKQLKPISIKRRKEFYSKKIFLPRVLHKNAGKWVELDYQSHILPEIDWSTLNAPNPACFQVKEANSSSVNVYIDEVRRSSGTDQTLNVDKSLNLCWFSRRLSDIVPNPWQAARIVQEALQRILSSGETEDTLYDKRDSFALWIREYITKEVDRMAEDIFHKKIRNGQIRFDLKTESPNYEMKKCYQLSVSEDTGLMTGDSGGPTQRNLFEPIYTQNFDTILERNFARYLDEQSALTWWHRVAVRQSSDYYLRGWKQDRIWPDFVAMATESNRAPHLLIFETKGQHLRDNADTEYKERVLKALEDAFNCGTMTIQDGAMKGTFRLVFEHKFADALDQLSS